MRSLWIRVAIIVAGLGLLAGCGFGQVTTGRILGMVLDPSGATVGDANVAVLNLQTNATQKASSDTDGRFLLRGSAIRSTLLRASGMT